MKATHLFPILAASLLVPVGARAHCDTLDGPVVGAARTALENGRLEPVLAWVQPGDEAEIRHAFASARAVRKGGKEARELADRWFFETLVRVHRAGEGAPYTGLKPAGTPDPAVAAADRLLANGDAAPLEELLVQSVREGLHAHVARLKQEKPPSGDVAAGRRWVAAYVPFVHWAEGVHRVASSAGAEHGAPAAQGGGHPQHGAAEEDAGREHARTPEKAHAH
ncbi:MAG TPA: DUF6448 family protein [Anaeromyxobacter sp.]